MLPDAATHAEATCSARASHHACDAFAILRLRYFTLLTLFSRLSLLIIVLMPLISSCHRFVAAIHMNSSHAELLRQRRRRVCFACCCYADTPASYYCLPPCYAAAIRCAPHVFRHVRFSLPMREQQVSKKALYFFFFSLMLMMLSFSLIRRCRFSIILRRLRHDAYAPCFFRHAALR